MADTFDEVWEDKYKGDENYRNHYPWSNIVSLIMSSYSKVSRREDISILEIGCGNGNNLWFAAREGFSVAGIDGSETAIQYAREWFAKESLSGDFKVGNFADLPFENESFDLAFDRAALSLTTKEGSIKALTELKRVVKKGGKIFLTPYSDRCTSYYTMEDDEGVVRDINIGTVTGSGGQVRFYGLTEAKKLVQDGWKLLSIKHIEEVDVTQPERIVHGEWHILAEKI
jgi:SAM-dependent methyltransferase